MSLNMRIKNHLFKKSNFYFKIIVEFQNFSGSGEGVRPSPPPLLCSKFLFRAPHPTPTSRTLKSGYATALFIEFLELDDGKYIIRIF